MVNMVRSMIHMITKMKEQKVEKVKACIFDLDGTLADTLESMAISTNIVLAPYGLGPVSADKFRYYAGDGAKTLVDRVLHDLGDHGLDAEVIFKAYKESFDIHCMDEVKVYEGMHEALGQLKAMGMKLGVVSNKPHAQTVKVIADLFGDDVFDWAQGQMDGIQKKPDPSGPLAVAARFGVSPDECMYIGDTNVDMQTGNNAGMHTVGVLWGFRTKEELLENGAHKLAVSPLELPALAESFD